MSIRLGGGVQDPLTLVYDPSHINIALHVRRGDVARDPEKHAGRLTSDVAYANAVLAIQKLIEGHPQFGPKLKGRIRVHVYSQGVKVRDEGEGGREGLDVAWMGGERIGAVARDRSQTC